MWLALLLLVPVGAAAQRAEDWRRIASDADRTRLRGWRDRWVAALPLLPPGTVVGDPMLFDPDGGLDGAMPPPTRYRCRLHRLPDRSGTPLTTEGWQPCRIAGLRLMVEAGSHRLAGRLFGDTTARAIFLGTVAIGDERRPLPYGRDRLRDSAGLVHRIGAARWRLVMPGRAIGGSLDIMELVPA